MYFIFLSCFFTIVFIALAGYIFFAELSTNGYISNQPKGISIIPSSIISPNITSTNMTSSVVESMETVVTSNTNENNEELEKELDEEFEKKIESQSILISRLEENLKNMKRTDVESQEAFEQEFEALEDQSNMYFWFLIGLIVFVVVVFGFLFTKLYLMKEVIQKARGFLGV